MKRLMVMMIIIMRDVWSHSSYLKQSIRILSRFLSRVSYLISISEQKNKKLQSLLLCLYNNLNSNSLSFFSTCTLVYCILVTIIIYLLWWITQKKKSQIQNSFRSHSHIKKWPLSLNKNATHFTSNKNCMKWRRWKNNPNKIIWTVTIFCFCIQQKKSASLLFCSCYYHYHCHYHY